MLERPPTTKPASKRARGGAQSSRGTAQSSRGGARKSRAESQGERGEAKSTRGGGKKVVVEVSVEVELKQVVLNKFQLFIFK
jgi:hypothetical protein